MLHYESGANVASPASRSTRVGDRYARQVILPSIGPQGQGRLAHTKVLLVGCGALGSAAANLLVRAGIGTLTIVDRDYVELHNLQRQALFDESDVAEHWPKAEAAAAKLRRVNREVTIIPLVADVDAGNIESIACGADVIVDGTDNFETRYLLNDVAVKWGRPWIYGGVIGNHGSTMTVRPGTSACLRCVFPEPPSAGTAPTCDTAGVLGPAVAAIAALQVAEVMKLAVGDEAATNTDLVALDLWRLTLNRVPVGGPRHDCPTCAAAIYSFLDAPMPTRTTVLCGSDAVQVRPTGACSLDLEALADRLRPAGDVKSNPFLVRFREPIGGCELTIFSDGRAIINGTTDPAEARSLYARFVGI